MAAWSGFTDEEVVRLKEQTRDGDDSSNKHNDGLKKASITNSSRKQRPREKIRTRPPANAKNGGVKNANLSATDCINSEAAESCRSADKGQTETPSANSQTICVSTEEDTPESERVMSNDKIEEIAPFTKKIVSNNDERQHITVATKKDQTDQEVTEIEIIEEPERIQAIELSALQKMQSKQQQMEEENKKKKALLQQTIAERFKKTQKETRTLAVVQEELKHLDSILSADVAILRDKIEAASIEYLRAQKRYERAEAEFVAAKMNLHRKTECKEQLTEHLYVIIEENEARKAKKLEELMSKLEMQETLEQCSHSELPDKAVEECIVSVGERTSGTEVNAPANANETSAFAMNNASMKAGNVEQMVNQS